MEKKIIGHCAVDSGQLVISDPCYLRSWRDGDSEGDNHYADACRATLSEDMGGEVLVAGSGGTGVAVSTGYGDGCYPVQAIYKHGRVKEIRIKFF
jgi:hypothetical protein